MLSNALKNLRLGFCIVPRLNLSSCLSRHEQRLGSCRLRDSSHAAFPCGNLHILRCSHQNSSTASGSYIVQMRGLDFEATEDDVIGYFRPLQITPVNVNLPRDMSGRAHGVCEVEFSTPADVVTAMRKKNAFMGNKFIRLSYKSSSTITKDTNILNSSDASSNSLSSRIFEGQRYSLRMRNLPKRITDQAIFEFFSNVGVRPMSIQTVYDTTGCRTGEVDIGFSSQEDMTKALVKNYARFGQHYVELIPKEEIIEETKQQAPQEATN